MLSKMCPWTTMIYIVVDYFSIYSQGIITLTILDPGMLQSRRSLTSATRDQEGLQKSSIADT
jgi:hypothetical protein